VRTVGSVACVAFLVAATAVAQEEPKVAGKDVPPPKRTKTVAPQYPAAAQAQGQRGIVILEIVIDAQGKVASVDVVRSIPGLDEAAVTAVKQWEYELTRVDGKPVSVRLTVPITFALKVPDVKRQDGIPELVQGASPVFPQGVGDAPARATAQVTLDAEGRVGEAQLLDGQPPFSVALLQALNTWRFAKPEEGVSTGFRVEADFVPAAKGAAAHVELRLTGLRRSETAVHEADAAAGPAPAPPIAAATAPPVTAPPATAPPMTAPPAAAPPVTAPPATAPPATTPPAVAPATTPPNPPTPAPPATTPSAPPPASSPAPAPPSRLVPLSTPAPAAAPAPTAEVLAAPPRPVATDSNATTVNPSAVPDVRLEPGVPELGSGRRPVAPPFARMAGASGSVEVRFSVDAGGQTSVRAVEGPDLLKTAAEQAVASWVFRRQSAERVPLVAVFTYTGNAAAAVVRPAPQQ